MLTQNPATGEKLETIPDMSWPDVLQRVERAKALSDRWGRCSIGERSLPLRQIAELLRAQKHDLAQLMTLEMGKPTREGIAEVEKSAEVCDFYANHAAMLLASESVLTEATKSYVSYEPLGVVLGIMPWNFPIWQVVRFLAPTLMAGNAAVVKHASNVPRCGAALSALVSNSELPDGLVAILRMSSEDTLHLIEEKSVSAVSLTGSVKAGRAVAEKAGSLTKKTLLELGGSDPYIILADADIKAAAEACVHSRMLNCGQSCIAAKRFIAVEEIYDQFLTEVLQLIRGLKQGDPQRMDTEIGPMARIDLRDELHRQVSASIDLGASLICGGVVPERSGAWYPPTLLTNVTPDMPAFKEELFGPVAVLIGAQDTAEAIELANQSDFGLGAAIFTANPDRGEEIARSELAAGSCFVNAFVRSDRRLPFGGTKNSGYGRELGGHGIREFVNTKTVYIR